MNTAGGYSSTLTDITSQLPPAGETFMEMGLESWFVDQSIVELCLGTGPECNGRPQEALLSARGWWPTANGAPTVTEGQFYAMKFGPGGEDMFRPVGDPLPVALESFGPSGVEVQLTFSLHALNQDLTSVYDRFIFALRNDAGDLIATGPGSMVIRESF